MMVTTSVARKVSSNILLIWVLFNSVVIMRSKMMVMAIMMKMFTPSVVIMMLKMMVMTKMVTPSVVRKVQTAESSKEDTG